MYWQNNFISFALFLPIVRDAVFRLSPTRLALLLYCHCCCCYCYCYCYCRYYYYHYIFTYVPFCVWILYDVLSVDICYCDVDLDWCKSSTECVCVCVHFFFFSLFSFDFICFQFFIATGMFELSRGSNGASDGFNMNYATFAFMCCCWWFFFSLFFSIWFFFFASMPGTGNADNDIVHSTKRKISMNWLKTKQRKRKKQNKRKKKRKTKKIWARNER